MSFSKFAISVSVFALLTTVGAKLTIPAGPVPFTLQTVFVMLSGLIGGANVGLTSQLIYLLLGMFSPVFAGNSFGPDIFYDPSAGYLVSFPLAAFICGKYGHQPALTASIFWTTIYAQTIIFICGVVGLWLNTDLPLISSIGYGFIDLAPVGYVKAILTALIYTFYLRFVKVKTMSSIEKK